MRYRITALLVGLLFLASPASAVTIAELQAQVQVLLIQLAALQARTASSAPSSTQAGTQCPHLIRDLSRGSQGNDVFELQRFFIGEGLLAADSNTGYFGLFTESAVKSFQCKTMGLCSGAPAVNGYGAVGPKTRGAIASRCSSPGAPAATTPTPSGTTTTKGASQSGRGGGGGAAPQVPVSTKPFLPPKTPTSTESTTPSTKPSLPPHKPARIELPTPERIRLGTLFNEESTSVVNRSWSKLPRLFSEIPRDANGNPDYSSGSAVPVPPGFLYGSGNAAGADAFVILAPAFDGDVIKVNFGSLGKITAGAEWNLKLKVGLRSDAPSETRAQLRIGVVADKLKTADAPWEFLSTTEIVSGQTYTLSIPLGQWAFRDNLIVVFEAEKVGPNNYWQGIIVDDAYLEARRAAPWNSIGRGGIYPESPSKQNQILSALAQIPADWHRIEAPQTVADAAANAAVLKRIQDQGKKILLILGPSSEDYGWDLSKARYTNDPMFQQKCNTSWGSFRLSLTDFATYEENLTKKLQTLRDAGVKIEAFDIGNELDWVCSNGDLPLDRVANQEEIDTTTRAYAKLLEHSVRAINASYPDAITVSGVSANLIHGTGIYATGMIRSPGRVIRALSNLDGKNYLSLIDRIGMHFYPDPDNPSTIAGDLATYHSDAGSPNKPYWATEWGYAQNRFPTARRKDRYTAFVEFYDATAKSSVPVVENVFYYALDDFNWGGHTLVDSNYNLLPEASKFFSKF